MGQGSGSAVWVEPVSEGFCSTSVVQKSVGWMRQHGTWVLSPLVQPRGSSLLPLPWSSSSVLVASSLGTWLNRSPCPGQVQQPWKFGSWGAQLLPVDRHGPKHLIPTPGKVLFLLFQRNPYHPSFCRGTQQARGCSDAARGSGGAPLSKQVPRLPANGFSSEASPISTQSRGMRAWLTQPKMFSLRFVCCWRLPQPCRGFRLGCYGSFSCREGSGALATWPSPR